MSGVLAFRTAPAAGVVRQSSDFDAGGASFIIFVGSHVKRHPFSPRSQKKNTIGTRKKSQKWSTVSPDFFYGDCFGAGFGRFALACWMVVVVVIYVVCNSVFCFSFFFVCLFVCCCNYWFDCRIGLTAVELVSSREVFSPAHVRSGSCTLLTGAETFCPPPRGLRRMLYLVDYRRNILSPPLVKKLVFYSSNCP